MLFGLANTNISILVLYFVQDDGLHTRIAVVADPQLTDRTSYGFAGEGLALWGVKLLCDTYLVRAFSMVRSLRPEAVIFMGDLMDGARHYGAEEFGEAYARWRGIARLNEGARELHVAGNHDVGLGGSMCVSCALRFKDKISPLNYRLSVGNVTFVAVDTVTTAGSVDPFACMAHRHFRKEAHAFTSRVSEGRLDLDWRGVASRPASLASSSGGEEDDRDCRPRVLLTHIPLWRPSGTGCGEVGRAAGNKEITYMLRYTFQTTVEEELSATILEAVRPDLVLSGDDHDQCLVEHPAPWRNGISSGEKPRKSWWNAGDGVAERTVGTVSMLQGNIFPSIALRNHACPVHPLPPALLPCHPLVSCQPEKYFPFPALFSFLSLLLPPTHASIPRSSLVYMHFKVASSILTSFSPASMTDPSPPAALSQ